MDTENDSTVQIKEVKSLFTKERLSVTKSAENDLKACYLQNDVKKDDNVLKDGMELDKYTPVPTNEHTETTISKSKKLRFNRSLIPLRIAQFLWFASGSLCGSFLSLILINRGLTVKDFAFVFPMTFVFQLIVAYVCGIVADKLGNGKPVLLFLMLSTMIFVIGFLLSPRINEKSCTRLEINETCLHFSNSTSDIEYCKYVCSKNNTDNFLVGDENNSTRDLISVAKEMDGRNKLEMLENVFTSNETRISCKESCFCLDLPANNCVSAQNEGLKLLYAVLIWFFFSFWSTSYRFLDFASLNVAKKHNSNFGKERAFGMFGVIVATLLCNFVLNIDKSKAKLIYDNIFWCGVALFSLAAISAHFIDEILSPPGIKLTKKTLRLFTDIEIMSHIFLALVAGSAFSFNLFYNIVFLDSLNASKTLIGLYILIPPISCLTIYLTSKFWLRKLGMKNIGIISLLGYTINALCFSFLYNPWLSLIIDLTKPFSFHLFWIAIVTHSNKIAPEGFAATVNAVVGTVHFGLGRSFGVSVGGYLMSIYGKRTTYRILAGFTFVAAILYAAIEYTRHYFSKTNTKDLKENPEEMKSMREEDAERHC